MLCPWPVTHKVRRSPGCPRPASSSRNRSVADCPDPRNYIVQASANGRERLLHLDDRVLVSPGMNPATGQSRPWEWKHRLASIEASLWLLRFQRLSLFAAAWPAAAQESGLLLTLAARHPCHFYLCLPKVTVWEVWVSKHLNAKERNGKRKKGGRRWKKRREKRREREREYEHRWASVRCNWNFQSTLATLETKIWVCVKH